MEQTKFERDKRILSITFPDCVWILLLDVLLFYPKLLERFIHASVYFRSLIYPRQNQFLLARILPMLENPFKHISAEQHNGSEILQLVLPKLRQTCNRWCDILDNLSDPWENLDSFSGVMVTYVAKYYHDATNQDNDEPEFLSHFERSHSINNGNSRSPFVGQAAFLKGREQHLKQINLQFEEELEIPFRRIVSKYGHLLKTCRLYLFHHDVSLVLSHLLPDLVNVKTLGLELGTIGALTPNGELYRLPKWNLLDNLPLFLKLRTLKIITHKFPGASLLNKILVKAPNLKHLEIIARESCHSKILINETQLGIAKLKHLTIGFWYALGAPDHQTHRELGHSMCSLDMHTHLVLSTLQTHCSVMQNLCSLSLHFPCLSSDKFREWNRYTLPFPNLTTLKLTSNTWPCIDVSLLFKDTLENLTVDVHVVEALEYWINEEGDEEVRDLEEIQFLSCNAVLDEGSNIWNKLPRLRNAKVNVNRRPAYNWGREWKTSSSWSRDLTVNED